MPNDVEESGGKEKGKDGGVYLASHDEEGQVEVEARGGGRGGLADSGSRGRVKGRRV